MKKTSLLYRAAAAAVVAGLCSSCATVISGTHQYVDISSEPAGATVLIDGKEAGRTPLEYQLKRSSDHMVRLELAGYAPYEIKIDKTFNPWVIGNVIIGGVIGIVVDSVTGAVYRLTPDEIDATLKRGYASAAETGDRIVIASVLRPLPGWEKIGQMERL